MDTKTGWPELDLAPPGGYRGKELILFCAGRNTGKTQLTVEMLKARTPPFDCTIQHDSEALTDDITSEI